MTTQRQLINTQLSHARPFQKSFSLRYYYLPPVSFIRYEIRLNDTTTHLIPVTLIAAIPQSSNERGEDIMHYENHPVYVEQRMKLERTFKGKGDVISHQFHQFRQEVAPDSTKKTWEKNIIVEDANIQIIGNWAFFDILQYQDNPARAGMSMVHLLAVPREAIINGVYLTVDTVHVIDQMIELFKGAWVDPNTRLKVLQHQHVAISRRAEAMKEEPFADQALKAALTHHEWLESVIYKLNIEDFHYGLHLRPDHSADYLHLHT
jgi:hypothetical protein